MSPSLAGDARTAQADRAACRRRPRAARQNTGRTVAKTTKTLLAGRARPVLPSAIGRQIPRLAAAALSAGRPVAALAAGLAHLAQTHPKGYTAKTTDPLLTYMIVSADWRSGRRARPGKRDAALALRRCEDSVRRHWRILEAARLLTETEYGAHLTAEEHAASGVCRCNGEEGRTLGPGERWCRRRDRAEWTVVMPAHITEKAAAPYVARAVELLTALAGPHADQAAETVTTDVVWPADMSAMEPPAELVDEHQDHDEPTAEVQAHTAPEVREAVDNPAGQTGFSAPSLGGTSDLSPYSDRISKYFRTRAPFSPRPKTKKEAASRPQQGKEGRSGRSSARRQGRPVDPAGLELAREIASDQRFWYLRGVKVAILGTILTPYARNGWRPDDVHAAAREFERIRIERHGWGYTTPVAGQLHHGASYLRSILRESGYTPETPPTRVAARRAIEARAAAHQAAAERAAGAEARRQAAELARTGPARAAAHQAAAEARGRRRPTNGDDLAEQARQATTARPPLTVPAEVPLYASPYTATPAGETCQVCRAPGHDVQPRHLPQRPAPVLACEACETWHRKLH